MCVCVCVCVRVCVNKFIVVALVLSEHVQPIADAKILLKILILALNVRLAEVSFAHVD